MQSLHDSHEVVYNVIFIDLLPKRMFSIGGYVGAWTKKIKKHMGILNAFLAVLDGISLKQKVQIFKRRVLVKERNFLRKKYTWPYPINL